MPTFLVVVGVSVAISSSAAAGHGVGRAQFLGRACVRACKLFAMGLFLQGGAASHPFPQFDLSRLRCGLAWPTVRLDKLCLGCLLSRRQPGHNAGASVQSCTAPGPGHARCKNSGSGARTMLHAVLHLVVRGAWVVQQQHFPTGNHVAW